MNNTFSIVRLGHLLRKHFNENIRGYLISFIVFVVILACVFLFATFTGISKTLPVDDQMGIYFASLCIGGFIFTGNAFRDYQRPRSDLFMLMLPASLLEKYVMHWVVTVVGFAICHFAIFHVTQWVVFKFITVYAGVENTYFNIFNVRDYAPVIWLYLVFLLFHSIAFLGSISLRKMSTIFTAFIFFAVVALLIFINYSLTMNLFGRATPFPLFPLGTIVEEKGWVDVSFVHAELIGKVGLGMLTVLLWTTAFFKLKEKEA